MLTLVLCLARPTTAQEQTDTAGEANKGPVASQDVPGAEADDQTAATTTDGRQGAVPKELASAEESYLSWMIRSSGPVGFVLFAMSFLSVGLTITFILDMQRSKVIPDTLRREFESRIRDRKYQEAYELARNDTSFLGKVLAAGLSRLSMGYAQAVEAMQEEGEDESMRLEHRLSWLAILGTTGPLLGLLGTVEGIISSFRVIATSDTQPKPSLLARGISTSLFNTLEGLLVAIIATVAFMLLKNQAARLVLEVGKVSGDLMSRVSTLPRAARGTSGGSEGSP